MKRIWGAVLAAGLLLVALNCTAAGFAFESIQGKRVQLSDYHGKWVLVNFWATWCPPCLEELPDLVKLHQAHKDRDLVVIGVAMEYSSPQQVAEFAARHGISYPVVLGDDKLAEQIGEVDALPTSYLYDPSGRLRAYQQGAITRDIVEAYIGSRPAGN
jgi:thiol-disulfide isomerase/thioredoxin